MSRAARLVLLGLGLAGAPGCAARRPAAPGLPVGPRKAVLPVYKPGPEVPKIYVEADLGDGVPRVFMVDTGAVVSVLSRDVAEQLALETVAQPGRLVGLGGAVRWEQATVPTVALGAMRLDDVRFAVDVDGVPSHAGLVPVAGILGNNVWGNFTVDIDYPAATLTLYQPGALDLPVTARPLHFDGQHIRTAVILHAGEGEAATRQPLVLEVDTGARDVILNGPVSLELGAVATEGDEPILGVGAGDELPMSSFLRRTRRVPLTAVEIGGITVQDDVTARWLGWDEGDRGAMLGVLGMTGLVGHAVLDAHRVVLDYPGQRIALLPTAGERPVRDLHDWALDGLKRPRTAEEVRERARLLTFRDRMDEARPLLERWVEEHPDDAATTVLLARILRLQGEHEAARAVVAGLPAVALVEEGEIVAAVNARWLAGDADGASRLAETAVVARPDDAGAWIAAADARRAAGDVEGARAALRRANRIAENPDGHLIRRAWLAAEAGDRYGAITHARRLMELYPSGGVAAWLYARQVVGTDDEPLFEQDAERALQRLHPGDGPFDFLSGAFRVVGEAERARALMEAGRGRDCARAEEAASRANCHAWYRALAGQDLPDARADIEAALRAFPHRSEFLDTMAIVLEAQGELEAARDAAWHAAALAPDDVYLLYQAARLDAARRNGG